MSAVPDLSIVGGTVVAMDADRTVSRRDLHVADGHLAAEPAEGATVVDASGAWVVPIVVASVDQHRPPAERYADRNLVVGNPADLVVVARPVQEREIEHGLVVSPRDLVALVLDGQVVAGRALGENDLLATTLTPPDDDHPWLGTWIDQEDWMHQHLHAGGRYDETRGGRPLAWEGRFWFRGDRVVYLDDTGFWAFGQVVDGVLHHADFVLTPTTSVDR